MTPPSPPDHAQRKTRREDKIPFRAKSLFGMGSLSFITTANIVEYQIQQVLVFGMGMSPITKSVIIMIFRLWDAFIDPIMVWVSDNTRTRWGRRRPFMFVGTLLMVPPMNADVIDEDELNNGERREGSFESVFWMLFKFSSTLFAGLSGFLVVWVGFEIDLGAEQAPGVFRNIIWIMFTVPFVLSLLEAWVVLNWPLTETRMREIREQLEKRRGAVNETSS